MESEKTSGGDKYSKLAGNTIIFAISSFSSKLLTLIVQPFLTYAMAEISDLGLSKILSQYANLLIPFVSMGMSNAIIRFGLDKGNSEKQVFTNGLLTILGGFGILVLCWPVAQFLPDMAQYGLLIYIYVLMSCLRTLCTQFVRSRQWNKLVAVDGVLCTVATMAFYVLYLVGFKWGANGYLLAIISGDLVSVLFLMFTGRLWDFIELKGINKTLWKQMLHFSLPMIPAQISFWIINASDLFFVREMCDGLDGHSGDAWSGLLSTGYFLPTILTTLGLIFYDAWQLSAVTEEEGRAKFFTQIFRTYSSVLFCCAAGIIWLCRPVMHVMKSNYYYAWHFVPFLVLASTCSCFNQFMNSVFKVITAAMGVDSGKATYYTTFNCSGAYGVAKETYHCAGKKAHGVQNLAEALRNSCNIYFIQLGQRLGSSAFYDYFDAFGFTERTGVDLPNETGMMKYYTKSQLGEVELSSSAFGQAMAVTPLQVCTAVSAAVNGGYLVTPHVVDKITDQNGNVVEEIGANVRRQVISKSASETIRQIMEYEVGDGTTTGGGSNAYVAGYRIGGKSGTSEQLNMERRADGDYKKVASFAAVLPANDPEILVYVMLDDPNNAHTDYSSILAAPVVGNIISEIAPYLGIATDGIDRSQNTVKVPNLVGKEWSNAQVSLNTKGLKHQLVESESDQTAAVVTYQYPHAGATVASGTTIYLYTDTYSGSHTEVPDVSGKSADFARQMLTAAGLNCQVAGDSAGTVQSQSEAAGSSVQKGTVVTITCG